MAELSTEQMHTIFGVNVTPMDENGQIDFGGLERNLDFLQKAGLGAIVPCGNTAEFFSLTAQECEQIVSAACRQLVGQTTIVAGVGHDLDTAIRLARHAEDAGCDAVMVHHPPHPFLSGDGYDQYMRRIIQSIRIPVIPYVRAANVSDEILLRLVTLDQVIAVKYAVNDLQRFGSLVAETPLDANVAWICGTAEGWAPFFWAAGAVGFTSGLVNVAPKLSTGMLKALQENDWQTTRNLWRLVKPFENMRAEDQNAKNVSVVKEAMHQLGFGSRWVRPPISTLSEADGQRVAKILESWKKDQYF